MKLLAILAGALLLAAPAIAQEGFGDSLRVQEVQLGNQYEGTAIDTATGVGDDKRLTLTAEVGFVWILDLVGWMFASNGAGAVYSITFASGTDSVFATGVPHSSETEGGEIPLWGKVFTAPDSALHIDFDLTGASDRNPTFSYSARKVSVGAARSSIYNGED